VDTYANVAASCHADGEHVVVINDSSENTWALGQLTSSNSFVWIGLHFTSGAWTWDDGTALGSGFEAFSGAPPTNPSNPCVNAHQTDGSWLTFSCTATTRRCASATARDAVPPLTGSPAQRGQAPAEATTHAVSSALRHDVHARRARCASRR
jgi:Lectin C-type domain